MAELIELRHVRTGKRARLPERMVPAAKKNGFEVVGEEPQPEPQAAEVEAEAPQEEVEGYESMTNAELRELLTERELPTSGTKAELVARLQENE